MIADPRSKSRPPSYAACRLTRAKKAVPGLLVSHRRPRYDGASPGREVLSDPPGTRTRLPLTVRTRSEPLSPLVIRRAVPEDGPAVQDFVFATLRSYGLEPDPTGLDADVLTFGAASGSALELVAEADGAVVGSVMVSPRGPDTGWLSKFFVASAHRGRGIGRILLAAAMEKARAAGYRRLELETRTIFPEAAHLYESTGWVRGPDPPPGHGPDRSYSLDLDASHDASRP